MPPFFSLTFRGLYGWLTGYPGGLWWFLDSIKMKIIRLILVLLFFVSGSAFADYPAILKTAMFNNSGGSYVAYSTAEEACQRSVTAFNPTGGVKSARFYLSGASNLQASYNCEWTWYNDTKQLTSSKDIRFHCPYLPATLNGSTCTGASTGAPPPCVAGEKSWLVYEVTYVNGVSSGIPRTGGSDGSCEVDVIGIGECWLNKTAAKNYCQYQVQKTGVVKGTGSGAPAPSGSETPGGPEDVRGEVPPVPVPPGTKCPTGTVSGGVDSAGRTVCIGSGSNPKNPPPTAPPVVTKPPVTVTNADGSTTTTNETRTTNADGSVTVKIDTVTTAADGTVTKGGTSSTGSNSSGSAGQADTPGEDTSFCKQNPYLAICRNSVVSGSCEAIACEGDAVQCATLRAAAAMECREKKDREDTAALPSTGLGSSILGGSDPMKGQIDAAIAGTTVDMSNPALDSAGFVSGRCIGNKSFAVMGRTVTVEFDSLCGNIEPLKYVVLACAFLAAYLIVSKSVLNA